MFCFHFQFHVHLYKYIQYKMCNYNSIYILLYIYIYTHMYMNTRVTCYKMTKDTISIVVCGCMHAHDHHGACLPLRELAVFFAA